MLKGFRDFVLRGNVLDLAVGVVIGAAFGAVVTSFTKDVLMQAISAVVGKPNFDDVVLSVNHTPLFVGKFLSALISFLLIAAAVYFAVVLPTNMLMARMKKPEAAAEPTTKACPECTLDIPLVAKRCPNCTAQV
jgi:large conductance mechanosensitive channel